MNTCVTFSLDFYYGDWPVISLSCPFVFLIDKIGLKSNESYCLTSTGIFLSDTIQYILFKPVNIMIISQILYLYGNEQDRWMDNYIRSFYQILEASN